MDFVFGYSLPAIFAFVCAIVLFIRSKKGNGAHTAMAILMLTISLAAEMYAMFFHEPDVTSIWYYLSYTALAPLCPSVLCMFVIRLTSPTGYSKYTWHLYMIPGLYVFVLLGIELFMTPEDNMMYVVNLAHPVDYYAETTQAYDVMRLVGYTLFGIGLPIELTLSLAWGESRLRSYRALIEQYYASNEGKSIYSGHVINICILLFLPVAVFLTFVPINADVPEKIVWTMIGLECLLILLVTLYAYKISYTAEDLMNILEEDTQQDSPLTTFDTIKKRLIQATNEEIYLDPNLSLITLAQTLGTNRTYVQKVIMDCYGSSFSDYVNSQRIRHALTLLQTTPRSKIVLKKVAVDSGYSSPSSFYRNFELFTGYSPTEWMNKNLHD